VSRLASILLSEPTQPVLSENRTALYTKLHKKRKAAKMMYTGPNRRRSSTHSRASQATLP